MRKRPGEDTLGPDRMEDFLKLACTVLSKECRLHMEMNNRGGKIGSMTKYLASLLIVGLMGSAGCSAIVRVTDYVPKSLPKGWTSCKSSDNKSYVHRSYDKYCYKFTSGDVRIWLGNSNIQQMVITRHGPPLIPLFPYTQSPIPAFNKSISFNLTIDSGKGSTTLDFAQSRMLFPDGRAILPSVSAIREFYEDYPAVPKKSEKIPLQQVTVSEEITRYWLLYS